MSATNRGGERIANDVYPTPGWCTRRLLEALERDHDDFSLERASSRMSWCDPCAGDGAILRELDNRYRPARLFACELREECRLRLEANLGPLRVKICDWLATPLEGDPLDVLITNPPFSLAEDVIKKALHEADWVVMLVRQGFVGHQRAEWMRENMPDTYELPDRPSFASKAECTACGFGIEKDAKGKVIAQLVQHGTLNCPRCGAPSVPGESDPFACWPTTDAADYCWLVWTPERDRRAGQRQILPATPLAERKADMVRIEI